MNVGDVRSYHANTGGHNLKLLIGDINRVGIREDRHRASVRDQDHHNFDQRAPNTDEMLVSDIGDYEQ